MKIVTGGKGGCYKLTKPYGVPEIVTLGLRFRVSWYNAVSAWSSSKATCALHY